VRNRDPEHDSQANSTPNSRELVLAMEQHLESEGVLPFDLAETLRKRLGFSKEGFATKYLSVSARTYGRFGERGRLSPTISTRVYRLARLLEAATNLHAGDVARALRWIDAPNLALGGRCPIDGISRQADFDQVMGLVGALEDGVFV